QGILASEDATVWPKIDDVYPSELLRMISAFARGFGRESAADLCLAYARGQDWIDGVVVGMETEEQLDTNLRLSVLRPLPRHDCEEIEALMPRVPTQLLNPALWPKK